MAPNTEPKAAATPAEPTTSTTTPSAAEPEAPARSPKPTGIVVNPARESRAYALLTIEEGPEILAEVRQEGDASAVVQRVLDGVEKHGVKVIRVWQHGDGATIAQALRNVVGLKVLEIR